MRTIHKLLVCRRKALWGLCPGFLSIALLLISFTNTLAQPYDVTESNLRDTILGRRDLALPDQNSDGRMDVADLVRFLGISTAGATLRYVGTMDFHVSTLLTAHTIELALPANSAGETVQASLKSIDSPFLSDNCTMGAAVSAEGLPNFTSPCSGVLAAGDLRNPLPRSLQWELAISDTRLSGTTLDANFTMTYLDLNPRQGPVQFTGTLHLSEQSSDGSLLFENAGDMDRLAAKYGL